MRRFRFVPAALLTVLAVVGAACGGGGSTGADATLNKDEQAYADAFAKDLADQTDGLGVSAKQGDCMGTVIMAELGTGPFEKAKVTPKDLGGEKTPGQLLGEGTVSEEQAGSIYDAWSDCGDMTAVFANSIAAEYDGDATAKKCLQDGLRENDLMRSFMVDSFTSGEEPDPAKSPLKDLVSLITRCTTSGDGSGGALVDSIAQSLGSGGSLTAEESQCLAQSIVDTVGADKLLAGVSGGDFSKASPELQQAIVQSITKAAAACNVPLSKLGG